MWHLRRGVDAVASAPQGTRQQTLIRQAWALRGLSKNDLDPGTRAAFDNLGQLLIDACRVNGLAQEHGDNWVISQAFGGKRQPEAWQGTSGTGGPGARFLDASSKDPGDRNRRTWELPEPGPEPADLEPGPDPCNLSGPGPGGTGGPGGRVRQSSAMRAFLEEQGDKVQRVGAVTLVTQYGGHNEVRTVAFQAHGRTTPQGRVNYTLRVTRQALAELQQARTVGATLYYGVVPGADLDAGLKLTGASGTGGPGRLRYAADPVDPEDYFVLATHDLAGRLAPVPAGVGPDWLRDLYWETLPAETIAGKRRRVHKGNVNKGVVSWGGVYQGNKGDGRNRYVKQVTRGAVTPRQLKITHPAHAGDIYAARERVLYGHVVDPEVYDPGTHWDGQWGDLAELVRVMSAAPQLIRNKDLERLRALLGDTGTRDLEIRYRGPAVDSFSDLPIPYSATSGPWQGTTNERYRNRNRWTCNLAVCAT